MLTKAEIISASNVLDETDTANLTSLLRNSVRYKNSPSLFSDLSTRLTAATGTVRAQQINAMLDKIEELGIGEVIVRGEHNELDYNMVREREAMLNYIISVLYQISDGLYIYGDPTTGSAINGYGVGQRDVEGDFI